MNQLQPATKSSPEVFCSRQLLDWMRSQQIGFALTTYQTSMCD